ncbi:hypothetical protein [Rufibacter sp. XAAS-G3-1]|uniref:hypothetical protein n=1 Tax=Rufibacter sp. XAAS-G3-1 TaxID=2729134 RepID=UPI0015E7A185|nr:hypothetical protein [Rufibacter sp. XAAS-G3-1]
MKFPKLLSIFFALSLFVLGSCSEDEDTDPITGIKSCQPVKLTDDEGFATITYTNDKIANFTNEEYGTVTVQYHSNGNKAGKPSKMIFGDGEEGGLEYLYDEQGRLIGTLLSSSDLGGAAQISEFEYTNNRISKTSYFLAFPSEEEGEDPTFISTGFTTYEYDSKGNVLKAKVYYDNPATEEDESTVVQSTTDYTYDTKNSPTSAFQNLFVGIPSMNPAGENNVLTEIRREGNTVDKDLSFSNVYVFNENGYPTKTTRTSQNGDVSVINIEYSCK